MKLYALAAGVLAVAISGCAQMGTGAIPQDQDQRVFVMGGEMTSGDMLESLSPLTVPYDDILVVGAGYQHFLVEPQKDLKLGIEVGGAVRTGGGTTGEAWAGGVARYDGIVVGDSVRISPSMTIGASVVSGTMGMEAEREAGDGLPGDSLFYFSPEISISFAEHPESEFFWRVHHRSGAWNTFGGGGSANATMVGIRASF